MTAQMNFIEIQLWIVIGLLAFLITTNFICNLRNLRLNKERENDPPFAEMWDKNQLSKLINEAVPHVKTYPNHVEARFFLGKALMAQSRHSDARSHFEHLLTIEPTMRETYQEMLDEIERVQDS